MDMQSIRHAIVLSNEVGELTKKLAIWLMEKSQGLTQHVSVSIGGKLGATVAREVRAMISDMGKTRLNRLMLLTGAKIAFSARAGIYTDGKSLASEFGGDGGTVWLADCSFSPSAERLEPNMAEIKAIVFA